MILPGTIFSRFHPGSCKVTMLYRHLLLTITESPACIRGSSEVVFNKVLSGLIPAQTKKVRKPSLETESKSTVLVIALLYQI